MTSSRFLNFFRSQTARLAGSYLAVIMVMSLCFSIILYNVSASELDRQLPPSSVFEKVEFDSRVLIQQKLNNFLAQQIEQSRQALIARLVLLNLFVLAAGTLMSYFLARQTLQPIEENIEAQNQFVSDASHELRTPLTVLKTTNEVALRKKKLDEKTARSLIANNITEVSKLQQLTDGLLMLAKHEQQPLPLTSCSLPDIATEAINTILPLAKEKQITIDDHIPQLTISGNQASLTQALVILLDNAIKYSLEKSTIHFNAAQTGEFIKISVRDHGIGIAPDDLEHIFDRFYRADQSRTKQKVEGYGIGLALAKKIIEQHSGALIAMSELKKGSEFIVTLPK